MRHRFCRINEPPPNYPHPSSYVSDFGNMSHDSHLSIFLSVCLFSQPTICLFAGCVTVPFICFHVMVIRIITDLPRFLCVRRYANKNKYTSSHTHTLTTEVAHSLPGNWERLSVPENYLSQKSRSRTRRAEKWKSWKWFMASLLPSEEINTRAAFGVFFFSGSRQTLPLGLYPRLNIIPLFWSYCLWRSGYYSNLRW